MPGEGRGAGRPESPILFCKVLLWRYDYYFLKPAYFARESAGQVGEGQRERIPSRPHTVGTEPDVGLEPMNREIMT